FSLVFDLTVPLTASLNTESGRDALDLGVETKELLAKTGEAPPVHAFRVRPGDDASCLNLYKPESPRILGAPPGFIGRGGFAWSGSLAESPAELENPWLLLDRQFDDGAIAAIGDMNTVMWILHKGLGQDVELVNDEGELIKLRLVGLLTHSIFQGELVVSEKNFLGAFPQLSGHGWFLIDAPSERTAALERALRTDLADYGAHVQTTGALLAGYKQVENTYLSTFQILGGLGLLLGTLGLAVVLYRNVNERRGELALLRAVGFSRRAISVLIFSETAALLAAGLIVGGGSALLAVTPQLTSSDSEVSLLGLVLTLVAILASGLMASLLSLRTALRAPLLPALRAQ
ncbi:MAG: hypothetical protein MK538_10520, partial [Planctomycetes bacterium]|nr:hypothetical protein [Planctomycetota bacterium]